MLNHLKCLLFVTVSRRERNNESILAATVYRRSIHYSLVAFRQVPLERRRLTHTIQPLLMELAIATVTVGGRVKEEVAEGLTHTYLLSLFRPTVLLAGKILIKIEQKRTSLAYDIQFVNHQHF